MPARRRGQDPDDPSALCTGVLSKRPAFAQIIAQLCDGPEMRQPLTCGCAGVAQVVRPRQGEARHPPRRGRRPRACRLRRQVRPRSNRSTLHSMIKISDIANISSSATICNEAVARVRAACDARCDHGRMVPPVKTGMGIMTLPLRIGQCNYSYNPFASLLRFTRLTLASICKIVSGVHARTRVLTS